MHDSHARRQEWETFYLLVGTAGASLAHGSKLPISRAHSAPALLAFVLDLVLSAVFLMPSLGRLWFGVALPTAAG